MSTIAVKTQPSPPQDCCKSVPIWSEQQFFLSLKLCQFFSFHFLAGSNMSQGGRINNDNIPLFAGLAKAWGLTPAYSRAGRKTKHPYPTSARKQDVINCKLDRSAVLLKCSFPITIMLFRPRFLKCFTTCSN